MSDPDSSAKYQAEVVIRVYSEPKREDFEDERTYLEALEAWIYFVEQDGETQIEKLLHQDE